MFRIKKTSNDDTKRQGCAKNQATCQTIEAVAEIDGERCNGTYQACHKHQEDQPGERQSLEQRSHNIRIGRIRRSAGWEEPKVDKNSSHLHNEHAPKFFPFS